MEKPKKRPPPRPPVLREPPRVIRSKLRFFLVLILFFATAGSLYWFVRSDHFAVSSIEMRGQDRLSGDAIVESTGLVLGVNIWQVDVSRLEEHLLLNRRICSVYVQKYLPDTIVIQITEYGPLALVTTVDGFAEVDENQTVMSLPRTIGSIDLPILTGTSLENPVIGQEAIAPFLEEGLACVLEARDESYLGLVEVNLDDTGSLALVTREGIRIILGRYENGFRKAFDIVEPILADIRASQSAVEYIDMRAPDKPVVRQK